MNIALRPAAATDMEFVRGVHHEAFRELVERQFGPWDAALQDQLFAQAWARGGYSIVLYDGVRRRLTRWHVDRSEPERAR